MVGDAEWKKMEKTKEDLHFDEENKRALQAFLAKKGQSGEAQPRSTQGGLSSEESAQSKRLASRGWFSAIMNLLFKRSA